MADTLTDAVSAGIDALGEMPEFKSEDLGLPDNTPAPAAPKSRTAPAPRATAETNNTNTDTDIDPENVSTETQTDAEELTDEEVVQAKTLFKMLNNPSTAKASMRFLAENMGFELPTEAPTTKKEVIEQTKDIIEEMKEAAPGLEFLIDKIGPVIKAHLENVRNEVRGEIETDRTERSNNVLKDESAKALTTVATKFKYENNLIPKNILTEMTAMMGKVQPSADLKPLEYISMLHDAARAKLGIVATPTTNTTKKVPTPAQRLASERVLPSKAVSKESTKMSLNEAIANAVQELSGN